MAYRELTLDEVAKRTFSDHFQFSFTMRMDRDEALALAPKVEEFINELKATYDSCRIEVRVLR